MTSTHGLSEDSTGTEPGGTAARNRCTHTGLHTCGLAHVVHAVAHKESAWQLRRSPGRGHWATPPEVGDTHIGCRTPGTATSLSHPSPPGVQRQLPLLVEVADLPAQQGHPALWFIRVRGYRWHEVGTVPPEQDLLCPPPCPAQCSAVIIRLGLSLPGPARPCGPPLTHGDSPWQHRSGRPDRLWLTLRSSSEEAEKNHVRCFLLMWMILKGKTLLDVVSSAARITLRAQGHSWSPLTGRASYPSLAEQGEVGNRDHPCHCFCCWAKFRSG